MVVAELANAAQEAGRLQPDPRRSLDERLDDYGGDLPVMEVEDALELRGVAWSDVMCVEEERAVALVEEVDPADRHRPDRVAVVRVAEADVGAALRLALLLEVLERHLERDLRRGRAGVRVEDAIKAGRRDLDQAIGQLGGQRVGEPQHRRVRDAVELIADRLVDAGMPVSVHVAPERGDAVDVATAVGADQVGALAALDDQRFVLRPTLLLCERVPQMARVEVLDTPFSHSASDTRPHLGGTAGLNQRDLRARNARTFARLPQSCISHHVRDRFRERS